MQVTIRSASDLGLAVRAVRRSSKVRLDDLAATAGVSKQFASDVEHGKPTVQLGLVLKLLAELGVPFELAIPEIARTELVRQRAQGVRPYQRRMSQTLPERKKRNAQGA
jgi:transcriptional regulator with XRE-family HTH domain